MVMYHPDNGYKLQTKHAERMILPSSSQKYSQTYPWIWGSWEKDHWKSRILSSFSYKTLGYHSLHTKAVILLLVFFFFGGGGLIWQFGALGKITKLNSTNINPRDPGQLASHSSIYSPENVMSMILLSLGKEFRVTLLGKQTTTTTNTLERGRL